MARPLLTQQREQYLVMLRTDHLATETRRPRAEMGRNPTGHKFLKGYEPTGKAGAMNPDCGREGLSETFDRAALSTSKRGLTIRPGCSTISSP